MIRFTIDSDGIQRINRFPAIPKYCYERIMVSRYAYIVEREETLSNVQAHLKATCTYDLFTDMLISI